MKKQTLGILIALSASTMIFISLVLTKQPEHTITSKSELRPYTVQEVASHSGKADCWTIIDSQVYDITDYVSEHPGGDEILRACGKDATVLFHTRRDSNGRIGSGTPHSSNAENVLDSFKIGTTSN